MAISDCPGDPARSHVVHAAAREIESTRGYLFVTSGDDAAMAQRRVYLSQVAPAQKVE